MDGQGGVWVEKGAKPSRTPRALSRGGGRGHNLPTNRRGPQVATTLTAATQVSQLELNMAALSFDIPESLQAKLDAASAPEPNELDHFFSAGMRAMLNGSSQVLR